MVRNNPGTIKHRPAMNWKRLEHQCHSVKSNEFYIVMNSEAAVQQISPCSKIDPFKLEHMDKEKKNFWRKVLWSDKLKNELFGNNKQRYSKVHRFRIICSFFLIYFLRITFFFMISEHWHPDTVLFPVIGAHKASSCVNHSEGWISACLSYVRRVNTLDFGLIQGCYDDLHPRVSHDPSVNTFHTGPYPFRLTCSLSLFSQVYH